MASADGADQWQRREPTVSVQRALASQTRADIHARVREADEPWTVRDVADAFDLHPNVARSHLEMLVDAGLLAVGRRKRPGGGRPAKVYRAAGEAPTAPTQGAVPGARLQVALLAALADAPEDGEPRPADARARAVAVAEGRRLAEEYLASQGEAAPGGGPGRGPERGPGRGPGRGHGEAARVGARDEASRVGTLNEASPAGAGAPTRTRQRAPRLDEVADAALAALGPHAPGARVVGSGDEHIDVAGASTAFDLVREARPDLADALERGLLEGAFAGAGVGVVVTDAGTDEVDAPVRRVRAARGGVSGPSVARRIDARALAREAGVVRAMREITPLEPGEVLEVIAAGPGSPAAFARWADRAAHELLAVERVTDDRGRPGIRLLIRKGAR